MTGSAQDSQSPRWTLHGEPEAYSFLTGGEFEGGNGSRLRLGGGRRMTGSAWTFRVRAGRCIGRLEAFLIQRGECEGGEWLGILPDRRLVDDGKRGEAEWTGT